MELPRHAAGAATRVKICGLTRGEDALHAARLGADYLGIVLAKSPRRADPREAASWIPELRRASPQARIVAVFVRPSAREIAEAVALLAPDLIQVHGLREGEVPATPVPWIRAVSAGNAFLDPAGADQTDTAGGPWAVLVDTPSPDSAGGSGRTFDWNLACGFRGARLFLAGGLGPDNVGDAIRAVRPWAVDASSRLESSPGRKDPGRVAAFLAAAREADRMIRGTRRAPAGDPLEEHP